jgi:hypothetical protein
MKKKTMVLARSSLSDVSSEEQVRVHSALGRVPSARVKTNLGSIIQVDLDEKHESELRSEVEKLSGWLVDGESSASMPFDRATKLSKATATAATATAAPTKRPAVRTRKPTTAAKRTKATKKAKVGMKAKAKARKTRSTRGKAQR